MKHRKTNLSSSKTADIRNCRKNDHEPKAQNEKDSMHNRDINSKTIFSDPVLCAQFFRDNFDVPMLKNVQPEDIEDISERYLPYLGTEFNADSVKKIRILDIGKGTGDTAAKRNTPSFFVSLIEHKSLVDYDVSMQLLRYMVCIWTEYRRENEAKISGSTHRKDFRYPVILPIVYYEGKEKWTAGLHLSDRIGGCSGLEDWIPDFRYEIIQLHDYTNQELLKRGNEMSLIMLINKIQGSADLEEFIHIPADELDQIIRNSPGHVMDILVSVMESLCFKIGVSAQERTQCVGKVRKRKMGYLFENMDKINIQEERRKAAAQRQKTKKEKKRADRQHKRADRQHKRADEQQKRADEQQKRADEQHKRADEQQKRADEQHKRADEQQKRADEQQKRADEQQKRAETAEEKLRAAEQVIRQLKKSQEK